MARIGTSQAANRCRVLARRRGQSTRDARESQDSGQARHQVFKLRHRQRAHNKCRESTQFKTLSTGVNTVDQQRSSTHIASISSISLASTSAEQRNAKSSQKCCDCAAADEAPAAAGPGFDSTSPSRRSDGAGTDRAMLKMRMLLS